ncbi:hypothetical protein [Hoeflea prorocentri]|uniref:HEPN domain-containing protein n=1 Tax=Hoeflea prorocentri TaxID=1922333 RepID=A0A9X3UJL8_9HYPH|nr:hypothetical protein [Hoeflea prorocentri]MCY6382563.1 hypothetical protein [Hoeflea prorocentri]MDA5400363.1 hypothetical protein [Hoeflea prorocentri]
MDSKFSEAIGLRETWPTEPQLEEAMSMAGCYKWAAAFFDAAETLLLASEMVVGSSFYQGPVIQNVGLATELSLKALLRGAGKTNEELKRAGHNCYRLYCESRICFDESRFLSQHLANTSHIPISDEIRERVAKNNPTWDAEHIDLRWRNYFDHLRLLDLTYDRPFRSRYVEPGDVILPDAEVIMIGTKLFLAAMKERL